MQSEEREGLFMHSIRTKISAVTIGAIIFTMIIAAVFGVAAIRNIGQDSSEQMLRLLCDAGQKNLNAGLQDVEQNVQTISAYVESDLDGLEDQKLQAHLDRVSDFFKKVLYNTNGVMTYYYRIDPAVSSKVKGFWFVNTDGEGFQEHEVTDITRYDTTDTSQLVWFTVPKATGRPVWLPPYVTDNLDARVISYNTPVYLDGKFVGVIGIELDYSFMAEQVDNITLYENGYAFVDDGKGVVIYHPHMDVVTIKNGGQPSPVQRGPSDCVGSREGDQRGLAEMGQDDRRRLCPASGGVHCVYIALYQKDHKASAGSHKGGGADRGRKLRSFPRL